MISQQSDQPYTQRQLKASEYLKKILAKIFINEIIIFPNIDSKLITVTEVKMSQDLKVAKAFVLPLGGKDAEEKIEILRQFSFLIRKVLSKKINMKFLPKILFAKDESFDYAEKIEKLIKQANK